MVICIRYTFFNCSSAPLVSENVPITCLSSRKYTVLATSQDYEMAMKNIFHCQNISNVLLPVQGPSLSYPFVTNLNQDIFLTWDVPLCRDCEKRGGTCGFKWSGSDRLVGCSNLSSKSDGNVSIFLPSEFYFGKIQSQKFIEKDNRTIQVRGEMT